MFSIGGAKQRQQRAHTQKRDTERRAPRDTEGTRLEGSGGTGAEGGNEQLGEEHKVSREEQRRGKAHRLYTWTVCALGRGAYATVNQG